VTKSKSDPGGGDRRANPRPRTDKAITTQKVPLERYTIDLLIKHPNISPDVITGELGLTPHYFWRLGEPRRTPTGTELGGIRAETMWRYVTRRKGRRNFFAGLREFVGRLRGRRDFIAQLTAGGGRVTLIVNLPGDVNMGDVLEPETLRLMSELGIKLGVEVFPKME
jgi:uncharacterized protein DUF4279